MTNAEYAVHEKSLAELQARIAEKSAKAEAKAEAEKREAPEAKEARVEQKTISDEIFALQEAKRKLPRNSEEWVKIDAQQNELRKKAVEVRPLK
jgi:hypothetical protein